jgi:hypothetical protein
MSSIGAFHLKKNIVTLHMYHFVVLYPYDFYVAYLGRRNSRYFVFMYFPNHDITVIPLAAFVTDNFPKLHADD